MSAKYDPILGHLTEGIRYASVTGATISTALARDTVITVGGTVENLTLTDVACSGGEGEIRFTGGTALSVTLPNTAKVLGSLPDFSAGKTYVINSLDSFVVGAEVADE